MRSAEADTFCSFESFPSLTPTFFSMSLRLGQEPRTAVRENRQEQPDMQKMKQDILGRAEAAAPVTLEKIDTTLDSA